MKKLLVALFLVFVATQAVFAGNDLSRAAISGDLQEVKTRMTKGEKVNDIDKWGWTALQWSVYYGNMPVTKYLLDNGADANLSTVKEYGSFLPGTTPLILAAAYGHDDAIEALLKKKADRSYVDRKGKKAIDYAVEYEFDKCVALLKHK
jgi:uncharacterized protein